MDIIRSHITEVEKVTGTSHQRLEPDQLRQMVKMAYQVDEDQIDQMSEQDLYDKYGDDFQERLTETEMVPGKRVYIRPGRDNIEQSLSHIRRYANREKLELITLESKMITTADHFGEAVILEAEESVVEQIKDYIREMGYFS